MKLSISPENSKIGKTPSVSLPPLVTCPAGSPCMKDCYANNHAYKLYQWTKASWDDNLKLWQEDPGEYDWQLWEYLIKKKPAYFRWHVGGDIPDIEYSRMVIDTAKAFPGTSFMIYTRRRWLNGVSLSNLAVLRSQWIDEQVDTHRRKFIVLPKGAPVPEDGMLCPGKCEGCRECWVAFKTSPIYIHKH